MRVLSLHMNIGIVSRTAGRSAIKAAAYIAGERLEDERTGLVYDYSDRDGVERTGIALSDQAPEWAHDRATLWNAAEKRETRSNSRTARRIIVNMPHEFNADLRVEADLKIAQLLADRYGAADYAAHAPDKHGDHRNYHTHFLIPTRGFENGQWAKNKDRILDDRKTGPQEIRRLRQEMAGIINEIAVREHLPITVEYLSFKDRGIEQEPTKHMGPIASQKERLGQVTDIGDKNRAAAARNERRSQLQAELNVIDIQLAKEDLKRKHGGGGSPAPMHWTPDERYRAFYRDTWERRAAMVNAFESENGQEEKALKQAAAQLQQSLEKARGFTGLWRKVTGRTREEKGRLNEVKGKLYDIARKRNEQRAAFERDRLQRLEALKAEQALVREERAQFVAQAVGEATAARLPSEARSPAPVRQTSAEDRKASRREYFRRLGAEKKTQGRNEEKSAVKSIESPERRPANDAGRAERRAGFMKALPREPDRDEHKPGEVRPAQTPSPFPAPLSRSADPAPAQEFEKASATTNPADRAARRRDFFRKRGQQRQQDRDLGPEHEL